MKQENHSLPTGKTRGFSKWIAMVLAVCMVITTFVPSIFAASDENAAGDKLASMITGDGELMAGASLQCITPTPEMYPLERKAGGNLVGVIDDLHVRVIALNDGTTTSLILSFETGRGPYAPVFVKELAEHTGVPQSNIFFAATHSHAAPEITTDIDLTADTNYAKWGRYVMQQMKTAADEAIANLEPVEVGIGYTDSYTNVNRNATYSNGRDLGYNGEGNSDKLLTAIQFNSKKTGSPVAFVVSHATHGVVMHANQYFDDAYEGINFSADEKYSDEGVLGVSADLPGRVSTYLEENFEGAVAIWLCGAAGDQNPIVMNEIYTANPETGEQEISHIAGGSVEILDYLGKIQYADVLRALASIESFDADVNLGNAFGATVLPGRDGNDDVTMHLQVLRIGDIALVGDAGELFNSTGVYMRDNSVLENTIIVNCVWNNAQQKVAYFSDDDGIINGGAMTSQAKYAVGYIDEYMTALMNDLIVKADPKWSDNGDGTAVNKETGETVIVGLDGQAGTEDDNRIVSPAGTVLLENAQISRDADGAAYVALGNGFNLYAGEDGRIGTIDDVVKGFGSYAQSDTTGEIKDPLNWRLLDMQDGEAVLMTEVLVDSVQFNREATDSNQWKDTNLRAWLNSAGGQNKAGDTTGFYDAAFTADEKAKIKLTDVSMQSDSSFIAYNRTKSEDWWEYYTTSGEDTKDYVWALSGEEAFVYFGRSKIATFEELGHDPENYTNGYFRPSDYAYAQGVKINTGGNGASFIGFGDSWVRSAGRSMDEAGNQYGVFWGSTGSLNSGRTVNSYYGALPVITVRLSGTPGSSDFRTVVQNAYDTTAKAKDSDAYDNMQSDAKTRFNEYMTAAQNILLDASATNEELWTALQFVFQASDLLGLQLGDKTLLGNLIAEIEALDLTMYRDDGKAELAEALKHAKDVYASEALEEDLSRAVEKLAQARLALRLRANTEVLEKVLAEVQGLDLTQYTDESVQRSNIVALTAAAAALVNDPNAEQAEVDELAGQLDAAKNLLIEKTAGGDGTDTDDSSSTNGSDSSKDTSDDSSSNIQGSDDNSSSSSAVNGNASETSRDQSASSSKNSGTKSIPSTGDTSAPIMVLSLLALAGAATLIATKKAKADR